MMPSVGDLCRQCLRARGRLCGQCRRDVLPQLAVNVAWLKLIGDAQIEQTRLQTAAGNAVAVEKAKRRTARRLARAQRGYRGLAHAILAA